jgi:hypothetical protein
LQDRRKTWNPAGKPLSRSQTALAARPGIPAGQLLAAC